MIYIIYANFDSVRPIVETHVTYLLLSIIYEYENYNALTEVLEILAFIIKKYAIPITN
jgi:hypothetical protein